MIKKFPRIPHLPWSPGGSNDDKRLADHFINNFIGLGNEIAITEKLDGSNLCLTSKDIFARSHSGAPAHPSFDLAKKMHAEVKHLIDVGFSVFGEWCYAIHSIEYDSLPGPYPFFVFGVRDEQDGSWFDWQTVKDIASLISVNTVPILFHGTVEDKFQDLTQALAVGKSQYGEEKEGLVIWPFCGLCNDEDFSQCTAKWVKADHPKDVDEHWMFKPIKKQGVIV